MAAVAVALSTRTVAFGSLAVLAVAIMGGGCLLSLMRSDKKSYGGGGVGKNKYGEDDEDEVDDVIQIPTVPLAKVQEFFSSLNAQMIQTIMTLDAQLAQYKDQLPQAQMMAVIKQHFEEGVQETQTKLLDQWNLTEEEMEEATVYYADDLTVKSGVAKLKRIHGSLSGETPGGLPPDLTEERMLEAMPIFFELSVRVMKEVVDELKQEGQATGGNTAAVQAVTSRFMQKQELACEEDLSEFGLTADLMGAALEHFKSSPQVMQAWQKGNEFQQMEYQKMGFM